MADSTNVSEVEKVQDEFKTRFGRAREFWLQKHKIFDFSYLQYRSILSSSAAGSSLGSEYLKAFGQQVFVPLTFQTIEAINSQATTKKTEIVCTSAEFQNKAKARFFQAMDNGEWIRSRAEIAKSEARYDALMFGNGYIGNFYINDQFEGDFLDDPRDKATDPEKPEGENNDLEPGVEKKPADRTWTKRTITRYKGMKPVALNPYYVFFDPQATCQQDAYDAFVYVPMGLEKGREYAVTQGWCSSMEDAIKRVPKCTPEKFDQIRETIDSLYQNSPSSFNRTDNTQQLQAPRQSGLAASMQGDWCVFICRYMRNKFEVRCKGNDDATLYEDYNIYPHKEIPIIVLQDVKIPHEFLAMGEPEILRWQQVETNKIHNYTLGAVLMATIPRYAMVGSYLQDESDASFANPFKPIRLKPIPGMTVSNALQAMPMSDVKDTPFKLMEMVRATAQATTGASDFVVSSNSAPTGTATESNNLVAATYARISEKIKRMDSEGISQMIDQWHSCFPVLYDEEMDLQIIGQDIHYRYLPYDRDDANENAALIDEAAKTFKVHAEATSKATGTTTKKTLEQIYIEAGYEMVIFASDLMGRMVVETKFTDLAINKKQVVDDYMATIDVLKKINEDAASSGAQKRFDTFKLGEDLVKQITLIKNIDDYIVTMPDTSNTPPHGSEPKVALSVKLETLPAEAQAEILQKYIGINPPPMQPPAAAVPGEPQPAPTPEMAPTPPPIQ